MGIFKKHLVCGLVVVVALVSAAAITYFYVASLDLPRVNLSQVQRDPFYRTPERLVADGVAVAVLTSDQVESLRRSIRGYYATTYREEYRERTEKFLNGGLDQKSKERHERELEAMDSASVPVLSYSDPRTYEGLHNIVGMFASGSLYNEELGKFGSTVLLFFFRADGETLRLERVLPVGEDMETYEAAPVEYFKRENTK